MSPLLRAFDAFADSVVLVDRRGCVAYLNAAAERLYGYARHDILGDHVSRLAPPEFATQASELLADVLAGAQGVSLETERLHRDGHRLRVWVNISPWHDPDGTVSGMIVVSRDVGPMREKEAVLAESEARFRTLAEVSPEALFVHCNGRIVWVNESAVRMFRAGTARTLIGRPHFDFIHPEDHDRISANWSAAVAGTMVDVIEARRLRCDGTEFSGEGRGVRLVWQGMPGFAVMIRDVSERRRTLAALEASEDRHRRIVAKNPDAIIIHCDGLLVYANRAATHLFRARSDADMLGRSFLDIVPERDHEQATRRRHQVLNEGTSPLRRTERRRLDGSEFTAEVTGVRYSWNGQAAILSFVRDVTPRVEAERGQAEAETLYRRILALNPQAIVIHCEGIIVYVNQAAVDMFGALAEEDLIGRDVMDFIHPDDHEPVRRARQEIAQGRTETAAHVRRRRLDGSAFETEATGNWISWRDRPAFMAIIRDITHEREAFRALQQSEQTHRTLFETFPDAIVIHVDGTVVFANQAAARMFGLRDPADLVGERIIGTVHPDDREKVAATIRTLDVGERLAPVEARRLRGNGGIFRSVDERCGYVWRGEPAVLSVIREIDGKADVPAGDAA